MSSSPKSEHCACRNSAETKGGEEEEEDAEEEVKAAAEAAEAKALRRPLSLSGGVRVLGRTRPDEGEGEGESWVEVSVVEGEGGGDRDREGAGCEEGRYTPCSSWDTSRSPYTACWHSTGITSSTAVYDKDKDKTQDNERGRGVSTPATKNEKSLQ